MPTPQSLFDQLCVRLIYKSTARLCVNHLSRNLRQEHAHLPAAFRCFPKTNPEIRSFIHHTLQHSLVPPEVFVATKRRNQVEMIINQHSVWVEVGKWFYCSVPRHFDPGQRKCDDAHRVSSLWEHVHCKLSRRRQCLAQRSALNIQYSMLASLTANT